MNKNYWITFFFSFFIFSGFTQDSITVSSDSLQKLDNFISEALQQYDYNTTIEYSTRLIDLASEIEDHELIYQGYRSLGITYSDLADSIRAKENYKKALEYAILTKNDTLLMGAYNNLGNIYSENKTTVEKGLRLYDKAIVYGSRIEGFSGVLTPIMNKGWTHVDNEQYEQAYPYLEKAKDLIGENGEEVARAQLWTLYGKYYSDLGEYGRAKEFFERSIHIADEDSLVVAGSFAYKEYAKMLYKTGAYKEGYHALEKHEDYEDKIFEDSKIRQMEAAYVRFKTEESNKQLELARREQEYKDEVLAKTQQFSIILVFSIFVMLLFLILLFRNNRLRRKLIGQLKEKNTELIAAKEEAERLSLLKTRFFSTVSHELRTPLYGVVGLTSLLLEDNKNSKQVEDLNSLKFSADYLLALINDILQMNKMESNLVQLEDIPFNFRELMNGIIKSFEFSRKQNSNIIELDIDENIPVNFVGDSVRLSQVIMNLVGNAVKFTERGKIWIKTKLRKSENNSCLVYFEIGDTGMGIPKNKQQEIFEEFSQLASNNYNYQGTGLGLPIVKKLLKLFDSRIELKSEEGKGSVFSFEVLFKEGELLEAEKDIETDVLPQSSVRRALIVDDNRINQVVTQRILEKRDFKCFVAGGGYEAIDIFQKEEVDLVLMDVNMPDISGMEATKRIREFNTSVPIIALTAVEIDEIREEILASGMNDIIVKPYDTHQFFNTVFKNLLVPVV